jgi:hypothetical protein
MPEETALTKPDGLFFSLYKVQASNIYTVGSIAILKPKPG